MFFKWTNTLRCSFTDYVAPVTMINFYFREILRLDSEVLVLMEEMLLSLHRLDSI